MKKLVAIFVFCFVILSAASQEEIPIPGPMQQKWQEAELVAIFHYDLHVFDGEKYNQAKNRIRSN